MATTPVSRWMRAPFVWVALAAWLSASAASAQKLTGTDLVQALQEGGYVLVIRNARSPEEVPAERERAPANLTGEREIDEHGQGEMSVIGYAFRELDIPIGDTWTGPAYRSRQSATYLGFGKQAIAEALTENAAGTALTQKVADAPAAGRNTVIVTHGSLIEKAFPRDARGIGTAETLIFKPREGGADLVARLKIEDWAKLAVN